MGRFSGTDNYGLEAPILFERYERRSFDEVHASILNSLPIAGRELDIGAGTGRDAAALAKRGFQVVAVEPTLELREPAKLLHPSSSIEWVDDGLPLLCSLADRKGHFDVILATAVWMHLDAAERVVAMGVAASLLAPNGLLSITLRRGPVPTGRRMFHVGSEETKAHAARYGLECVIDQDEPSFGAENHTAGVFWRRVAFRRRDRE